jgi:hypothetical protein
MTDRMLDVTLPISYQVIDDTLVSALEGGSNSWIDRPVEIVVEPVDPEWDGWAHNAILYGGWIEVWEWDESNEGAIRHTVTQNDLLNGLRLMAQQNPYQFGLMMSGDGDAITGDVLFQFVVLGEEVYG